jgi:hypothetical protein
MTRTRAYCSQNTGIVLVALLRKATSCFGCSRNVNVSFVVTSAAAGDEDLWLEVDAAAFDIVAYAVAVLLRRELRNQPFPVSMRLRARPTSI